MRNAISVDASMRLVLVLTLQLGLPVDKQAGAHWMLGAQQLAARQCDEALESFSTLHALRDQLATSRSDESLAKQLGSVERVFHR